MSFTEEKELLNIAKNKIKDLPDIEKKLSDSDIFKDKKKYVEISKKYSSLKEIEKEMKNIENLMSEVDSLKKIISHEKEQSFVELAEEEKKEKDDLINISLKKLRELMSGKSERDDTAVMIEIKAGTGGEEAGLFCRDMIRMYEMFCDAKDMKIEIMDRTETGASGAYKDAIIRISKGTPYKLFRFEGGGHRVQRVPTTESQGRVHTSMVTVAVIPEANDNENININPSDLIIETFRSGGAGGQHVNTTDSAVRIIHKPTGVTVKCEDQRSQHSNKERALKILTSKIKNEMAKQRDAEEREEKKEQAGSGERNERIRTYNFPQNRLTDHRINKSWHNLDMIMDGHMEDLLKCMEVLIMEKL